MTSYQLLPELSEDEYEALKADIKARGVQVPIEFDREGNVLDGHHRLRVCEELGITDYPRVVREFESADDLLAHVLGLNLRRRHLGADEKAVLCRTLRDGHGWSVRQIAERTGFSKSAVGRYLGPEQVFVPPGTVQHPDPAIIEEFRQMIAQQGSVLWRHAGLCWNLTVLVAQEDFNEFTREELPEMLNMTLEDFNTFVEGWETIGKPAGQPTKELKAFMAEHDMGWWWHKDSKIHETVSAHWDLYFDHLVRVLMESIKDDEVEAGIKENHDQLVAYEAERHERRMKETTA